MRLVLGSGSPRRKELLAQIGVVPDEIRPPEIDETPHPGERPLAYCRRIAREKAMAMRCGADEVALCADTTVALGRRILGKAGDAAEAARFLNALSGRRHKVITCIALRRGDRLWTRDVTSNVRMKSLSKQDVESYVASRDWIGKAGAYAIQGPAGAFIPWIEGSFTAVMGLPVHETAQLLQAAGYPVLEGWT